MVTHFNSQNKLYVHQRILYLHQDIFYDSRNHYPFYVAQAMRLLCVRKISKKELRMSKVSKYAFTFIKSRIFSV